MFRAIENPIQHRVNEYKQRQNNIDLVATTVKLARDFITTIRNKDEESRYHTEEELEGLMEVTKHIEDWMAEQVAAQKKLLETDDPVIVTSKVAEKVKAVEEHLTKLITKKKPKKVQPKKEPVETNETKEEIVKEDEPKTEDHQHDEL